MLDNTTDASGPLDTIEDLSRRIINKLPNHVVDRLNADDLEEIASESADLLSARLDNRANPIAERIGPAYRVKQLARYLPGADTRALTDQAVYKRAKQHQLVAYRSREGAWLFPAWQFKRTAGRLVPIGPVIKAWADLPHEGVLADVDLVLWMATRRKDLGSLTPAQWAASHGYDDRLHQAVRSVVRRAA